MFGNQKNYGSGARQIPDRSQTDPRHIRNGRESPQHRLPSPSSPAFGNADPPLPRGDEAPRSDTREWHQWQYHHDHIRREYDTSTFARDASTMTEETLILRHLVSQGLSIEEIFAHMGYEGPSTLSDSLRDVVHSQTGFIITMANDLMKALDLRRVLRVGELFCQPSAVNP